MIPQPRPLLPLVHLILAGLILPASAAQKPNFILILADDQGWGTTSVQIDPLIPESKSDYFKTPAIERLATTGLRFTNAYAAHCNCSPSRAAIQTGRSPAALHLTDIIERNAGPGYVGNKLLPPRHLSAVSKEDPTIAQLLKTHDPAYRTAYFGKWHLAAGGPAKFGYDVSDGPTGNGEGGRKINLPDDPKQIFSITRHATAFINEQAKANQPFFLQISHYATHEPDQSLSSTLSEYQAAHKGARHINARYGAMLHDLDTGIGQVLDAVKAAGIADHTYILYTSDNGCIPSDDPGNLNGPLKGYKASLWEGGVRVPFIVAGPNIPANILSRTPIVGYDLLPTILDLAGVSRWPDPVEGGSFKNILLNDPKAPVQRPNSALVFHWPHYQLQKHSVPDSTILIDGWKLHYWWETNTVQLFHLDADIGESTDLALQEPARVTALKGELESYLTKVHAQLPTPNPNYKPATDPALNRKANPDNDQ